jgi:hypothetical protein
MYRLQFFLWSISFSKRLSLAEPGKKENIFRGGLALARDNQVESLSREVLLTTGRRGVACSSETRLAR